MKTTERPVKRERPKTISARAVEIMQMLADGGTKAEIASALGLSRFTIERHLENAGLFYRVEGRGNTLARTMVAALRAGDIT